MRIFFLVLLLILNVYAEAKGSGPARSRNRAKKAKSTVVAKKSEPPRTVVETKVVTPPVEETSSQPTVVRDTIVDTVYVAVPDTAEAKREARYNVPLPRHSAFLGGGFSVGIGAGLFNASNDCDCLGIWQGQLEYHYRDYISGGIDVRFFGGTLDQDVMLMYQRYRFNVRFHRGFSGADFYASALFGLETTDLSEFRKELAEGIHGRHSSDSSGVVKNLGDKSLDDLVEDSSDEEPEERVEDDKPKNCEKMFSLDGFTLGLEAGVGLVVFRYLGLTASATYEFNFSWAQLVAFSPGIAFNLHEVWPWAHENLRATWVSFEMVFQRYFNRGVKEWSVAGFVGLQFGI